MEKPAETITPKEKRSIPWTGFIIWPFVILLFVSSSACEANDCRDGGERTPFAAINLVCNLRTFAVGLTTVLFFINRWGCISIYGHQRSSIKMEMSQACRNEPGN